MKPDLNDMYFNERTRDHIDRLYEVGHLAKIGCAACGSQNPVPAILSAQETVFEMIYRLSSEAVEICEAKKSPDSNGG